MGTDRREGSASGGPRSVRIEGDVRGSVIITGDGNVVTFAPPPRGETAPTGPGTDALYPALLRVRGLRGEPVGVGFLVGPRTALTCAHVLEAARAPDGTVWVDFPFLAPNDPLVAREAVAQLGGNGEDWEALRAAVAGRRVVLLLDELDLALERGFDLDVLRGCRALCQKEPGFRLVTASRISPRDIFRQAWESLPAATRGSWPWDFLQVLEVGPFTEEEARRLLDHPWAPNAPRFNEATCRELIALSGRHPYRLQRAAHHRYEALADPTYDWRAGYARDMEALE